MHALDDTVELTKKPNGMRMVNAERMVLISKLIDLMTQGVYSTRELAKRTGMTRLTVDRYRPLADDVIGKEKIDRNVIRSLQIRRTYELIEQLMKDLKGTTDTKERSLLYGSIYKFSSHLALITGLNVETHVNVDPSKLVIIRANKQKMTDRVIEQVEDK